jgi:general L-amino acid transport system permease protein
MPKTMASGLGQYCGALLRNGRVRAAAIQVVLVLVAAAFLAWLAENAIANLRRANIVSGFDFLGTRSGFEIAQTLVAYSADSTYARALLVGLLNTLLVAGLGIVFATAIGFTVGAARLSRNWLIAKIATVYIETLRNIPVLLQLVFWYRAVLSALPGTRQGYALPFGANLSNRGLVLPRLIGGAAFTDTMLAVPVAALMVAVLVAWARRRQTLTGRRFPALTASIGLLIGAPLAVFVATGAPLSVEFPALTGFSFVGGWTIRPELIALLLGLSLYTASFIAEIVRAGIGAVEIGQTEAAYGLGLRPAETLRLIVLPQAMRVMIPPLTNQYLNLTKNSSLAVAVGYPDLVSVFSGTVLNQTGQAVEIIFITMLVYLAISLVTSLFMNWFDRRSEVPER